jgi:branched-chain amino acid transport system permease protein
VGGPGTFAGATFGAFVLMPLTELLRAIGTWRVVLYSFFMVVFIILVPEGIFHYLQRKYHQIERLVKTE